VENKFMGSRRAFLAMFAAGILFIPAGSRAQSRKVQDLGAGKIIIAPRNAPDPSFANSVILLARYGRGGALGLMLHFRSDFKIAKALKAVPGAEKRTDTVYVGGPVEIPSVMALVRSKTPPEGGKLITGNLYLLASKESVSAAIAAGRPESDMRIYIGYAGWGPGQLDREVMRPGTGWFIFDYDESLVFDPHPNTLWERLIARTDAKRALLQWPPWSPFIAEPSAR
jgi:putative transcriptional regulator